MTRASITTILVAALGGGVLTACCTGDCVEGEDPVRVSVTGSDAAAFEGRSAIVRAVGDFQNQPYLGMCESDTVQSGAFFVENGDAFDGGVENWRLYVLLNADAGNSLDVADSLFAFELASVSTNIVIVFSPLTAQTADIVATATAGDWPLGNSCESP